MSEHLLKILLGELVRVRLVCQYGPPTKAPCGAVVEVPLSQLGGVDRCPLCQQPFVAHPPSPFAALAEAMRRVAESEQYTVEFVIPQAD